MGTSLFVQITFTHHCRYSSKLTCCVTYKYNLFDKVSCFGMKTVRVCSLGLRLSTVYSISKQGDNAFMAEAYDLNIEYRGQGKSSGSNAWGSELCLEQRGPNQRNQRNLSVYLQTRGIFNSSTDPYQGSRHLLVYNMYYSN